MVTLIVLDGFGYSTEVFGNAIKQAGTENLDKLKKMYPTTLLECCGEAVGLEKGQMGGSEVGHLNIGAGKVVYQDMMKISKHIETGEFFENKVLKSLMEHCVKFNSSLHIMGLLSDGGIHSKLKHLYAVIDMANKYHIKNVFIHAFTDGRDTAKNQALKIVKQVENQIENKAKIVSMCGRLYGMDREKRFERVQMAYDMIVLGQAESYEQTCEQALKNSYEAGIFDEFIKPVIIGKPNKIQSDDGVFFFNFRADRGRELTQAIAEQNIENMQLVKLRNLCFVSMCEYDKAFMNVKVAFPKSVVEINLASIISKNNMKQFHISETTKYAHVTFFLNGGIEQPFDGEERCLIESYDVADFSTVPQMKAYEITEKTLEAIATDKYDFIVVNLSNPDMVGHTGNMEATKMAIKCVDKCAYLIALATLSVGGDCIITADHGNADVMIDENNNPVTSHSMNPVQLILCSEENKDKMLLSGGALCNIAPTILKLLNLQIPDDMEKPLF